MKLLVQKLNRANGQPISLVPELVNCGDIHAYVDENLKDDVILTIGSVDIYDEADVRKDELCHDPN